MDTAVAMAVVCRFAVVAFSAAARVLDIFLTIYLVRR
jgi:hypothetical protein